MKNIRLMLVAGLMLLFVGSASAQDQSSRDQRKAARAEQKLEKEEQSFDTLKQVIKDQNLVLEAHTIQGKYGSTVVAATNNFILIDGDKFILQTADPMRIGYNGMGGLTAKGTVTDYEYTINEEKGYITIIAQVSTFGIGQGTLSMHISASGNGSATFTNNWGGRITFVGPVTNPETASIFKGRSLI